MKQSTIDQIIDLKAQTIGVEVEMNNITRRNAATYAAEYFGTGRYRYTASTNGYQTWSAWDAQGREWKFSRDCSIAGPDDERCEMVTPILTYDDMDLLQGLIRLLRKKGAKSCPSRGCGVHIHVGLKGLNGKDHDARTLRNLTNIMASHEKLIGRAIRVDEGRTQSYCRVVDPNFLHQVNARKPQTMEALADVWYCSQGENYGRTQHYNGSRYHMLNLHASFTKGTVEFRLFQFAEESAERKGGLHAGELKAYIQLCLAMSSFAKSLKYASPKEQQSENDKFAMRTWLIRMGFVGDEFETARDVLMKNLSGNAAWRYKA